MSEEKKEFVSLKELNEEDLEKVTGGNKFPLMQCKYCKEVYETIQALVYNNRTKQFGFACPKCKRELDPEDIS